ncbi:lysophospholipid acyltransferase family protein [Adhaeribacter terrigena]|uniref:lysophospholipid acyltransferase family protein n=1 Tax=Adhaeribacter terrigena TaxID=2793070 RepID=UPI001F320100|nr:lysophospholipid acyltransferase family protein [Adhaeribacter terrigena]
MKTSIFENGKTNNAEGLAFGNNDLFVNLGGMSGLKKFGNNLYRVWCVFSFLLPFIILLPFFRLFILRKEWFKYAGALNRFWSWLQLHMYGVRVEVIRKGNYNPKQQYIYAPNHSSYIDIPLLLSTVPGFLNFVGKASLTRVPLWGPIFKALYISVDRDSRMSRAKTYLYSNKTLDEGRSLVIFPEGKIPDENVGKELAEFKDGPFRLAIERKIPLVPVTMPFNHIFLPDVKGQFIVNRHPLKIVFHEPIDTTNMTMNDLETLKAQVFNIIKTEFVTDIYEDRHKHHQKSGPLSAA